MPDRTRRFEDAKRGDLDPRVALGMLISQVDALGVTVEATSQTVGKIADDVMDIKLQRAAEAGQRKGFLSSAKIMEIMITIGTGVITAWGTVKALASSPPSH